MSYYDQGQYGQQGAYPVQGGCADCLSPVIWALNTVAATLAIVVAIGVAQFRPMNAELDKLPTDLSTYGGIVFVIVISSAALLAFTSSSLLIAFCCKPRIYDQQQQAPGCWQCAHSSEGVIESILLGNCFAIAVGGIILMAKATPKIGSIILLADGLGAALLNGILLFAVCQRPGGGCCGSRGAYGAQGGYAQDPYSQGFGQDPYMQ